MLEGVKTIKEMNINCDGVDVPMVAVENGDGSITLMQRDHLEEVENAQKLGDVLLTHNCGCRLVCGRLGTIASRMALDDNQATTIDGTRKGAGIIKSQGEIAHIQYYFALQKWIVEWFESHGLTKFGYEPGEDPNIPVDPNSLDFGEDEDISISRDKTNIDFSGLHREVDHTQDQKFQQV